MRLFVAIELPAGWRTYCASLAATLERAAPSYARWVAPPLLHLTIQFLGEQPPDRLGVIQSALQGAGTAASPFALCLGRLGSFGGATPRVLWISAIASDHALERLHASLAQVLSARSIAFDRKPLMPHITLGRARRTAPATAGRALGQRLAAQAQPPVPPPFTVTVITLMQSVLGRDGPQYTALERFELKGPPAAPRSGPQP